MQAALSAMLDTLPRIGGVGMETAYSRYSVPEKKKWNDDKHENKSDKAPLVVLRLYFLNTAAPAELLRSAVSHWAFADVNPPKASSCSS